jgi:paraquat-inducible protein A
VVHLETGNPALAALACRRCGKRYAVSDGVAFAACPHCGAAVRSLLDRLRDNRIAAVTAFLGLFVLTAGVLLPFISMSQLGHEQVYSMMDGITELYRRGNGMLASILLVFSVIFPYAKLAAILVATSRLVPISATVRWRLHAAAKATGRYSLLDIVVVAIIIVVVKFEGLAEARARAGTWFFAGAVFLSILAGICVRLDEGRRHERG